MKWYWGVLKNYTNAKGRAGRKEYWWYQLFNILITFLLVVFEGILLGINPSFGGETFLRLSRSFEYGVFATIYLYAVLVPTVCVTIRRFHDIGKSGRWCFLFIVPFASLFCGYLMTKPGSQNINEYGAPPSVPTYKAQFQRQETDVGVFVVDQSTGEIVSERYFEPSRKAPTKISFCRNCGHKLDEESNFCSNCGTRVLREW